MKERFLSYKTKFDVGDSVVIIEGGTLYRGKVEEIFVSLEDLRVDSLYSVVEKNPVPMVKYKVGVSSCGFKTICTVPEQQVASSREELPVFGD